MKRYVIGEKARKALCRVPRLLNEGRAEAALQLLSKLEPAEGSPLLLAHRIASLEAAGRAREAKSAFQKRKATLEAAKKSGPDEIVPFFVHLFAVYAEKDPDTASKVFRAGKAYGVGKDDFGMLWVKYCDRKGLVKEGLEALGAYFRGKKKLKPKEFKVLKDRYPVLAKDKGFKELFSA
ncbi:MAG: hypothetical protein ACYTHM_15300 [Planctomycetota bacterium]